MGTQNYKHNKLDEGANVKFNLASPPLPFQYARSACAAS
jgi:hypothetical protein